MNKTMTIAATAALLVADPASALTQRQKEAYCEFSAIMTSLMLKSVNDGMATSRIAEREDFTWHMETFAAPLGAKMHETMWNAYEQFTRGQITSAEAGIVVVTDCMDKGITPGS